MPALIFTGRYTLLPGKAAELRDHLQAYVSYMRDHNDRMQMFGFFVDEELGEVRILQVHPDSESLGAHMRLGQESGHFAKFADFVDMESGTWDLYGDPGAQMEGMLTDPEAAGAKISVHHATVAFDRLSFQPA